MGNKRIIMIHGRNFKPDGTVLAKLWMTALREGIKRDSKDKVDKFDETKKEMVYYGNTSNKFLSGIGKHYEESADIKDRWEALKKLQNYSKNSLVRVSIPISLEKHQ